MKTYKKLLVLTTLAISCLLSMVHAEDISLPIINKPKILNEGTETVLSETQIKELLPWAKNTKQSLLDLLESIQNLQSEDKVSRLTSGIEDAVGESSPKNSELLMRYTLNRALVVKKILDDEMDAHSVGSVDVKLRVLIASINLSLKYFDSDVSTLSKKASIPFATYGSDYFDFLTELNKSIFDASAQYKIERIALEWLSWDLSRDLNSATFAPKIFKIYNNLKYYPDRKITDIEAVKLIRDMKKLSNSVDVHYEEKKLEKERIANQIAYENQDKIDRELEEKNKKKWGVTCSESNSLGRMYVVKGWDANKAIEKANSYCRNWDESSRNYICESSKQCHATFSGTIIACSTTDIKGRTHKYQSTNKLYAAQRAVNQCIDWNDNRASCASSLSCVEIGKTDKQYKLAPEDYDDNKNSSTTESIY
jgi:hypothetical protein